VHEKLALIDVYGQILGPHGCDPVRMQLGQQRADRFRSRCVNE
jgi:hypothetical protein